MNKRNAFAAAVRAELRQIRAESAPKLAAALTLAALLYALFSGLSFSSSRAQSAAALKLSEAGKRAAQQEQAQQIAEAKMPVPDRPYRDPGNTIFVGSSAAELAELPQLPLSFLAAGESDLHPAAVPVSAKGKESFLFDDEISNPTQLLTGLFDPAFMLAVLLPLFILALCYNIISGEREQGTLSLNAASPVPLRVIMSAKLLVRAGLPTMTAVLALFGATLLAAPAAVGQALLLAAAVLLYGLFWGAVALAVNGFGFDSTGNALIISVLWICSVFIVPAFIDASVELTHPAPTRSVMVLAVRNSAVQADAKLDAAQAQFELEHAGTGHTHDDGLLRGTAQEKNYRRLLNVKAAQSVGDSIYAEQQQVLAHRRKLADRLRFLSPAMVMQDIIAELSGNGSVRFAAFMKQLDQFHEQWRSFFITRAEQGLRLNGKDYEQFPRFQYQETAARETSVRVRAGLFATLLFLAAAAVAAKALLNRFRLSGR
ncbi:DUF3526 domain-containing protein [Candidatus Electronema sp. JC]|uniref:DUF3526 domain-containing protein n=1 Tax=Candidatus Electronema sp. JC TaxID=3401570 RepID=UPI003AA8F954